MKQNKLSILLHEPKKLAAIAIFFLALVAFIAEIASLFHKIEPLETVPVQIVDVPKPLRIDSPLFTTALFGVYIPKHIADSEVKQSMLDVKVVGVMFSTKENESQVIIRQANGEEQYYAIGDTLPGGALIKRISQKGVVVLHNGILESLTLPTEKLLFDTPAKPLLD